MAGHGYKKYMKKEVRQGNPLLKIFIISFFGMLLLFTFLINYISKVVTVDTSIGDYKEQSIDDFEDKKIVDMNKLEMIQNEDQGRNFSDLMQSATDVVKTADYDKNDQAEAIPATSNTQNSIPPVNNNDSVYKVFIGTYTSVEQAKVAREVIQESDNGLNPIVKCIGTNEYTLQVGSFKSKQSAETMLGLINKNNLPGRIVQE